MRLKQIRLAGFKSFVEPTQVPLPGSMTAVVGPNGCGKSNIIEAVRWVLGESSAKNLRGEAMTDVIFNGSSARKPVSQASVELLFDNSEGRLGGPWASFAEISVRRLVNRDGENSYFLNGSRCRRKDITALFLGTGLGPRSYAIIEQGMITRLIESKPHELRVFIEEAAGISRYKEKRRESESRLRQTRDNLDRLNDVRDELGQQLEKLKRQATAARHYRELRARERQLKAELVTLRHHHLAQQLSQRDNAIALAAARLEASDSQLQQQQDNDNFLAASAEQQADLQRQQQQQLLQLAPVISRLEQQLLSSREQQRRQQQEQQRLEQERQQLVEEQQQFTAREQQLAEQLAAADASLQQTELAISALQQGLVAQDSQTQQQFAQLQQLRQQQSEQLRQREQALATSAQLQQLQQELSARVAQLQADLAAQITSDEAEDWPLLVAEQQSQLQLAEQQWQQAQAQLKQQEQAHEMAQAASQQLREQLADCRGQCQLLARQLQTLNDDESSPEQRLWLDNLVIEAQWQQAAAALLAPFARAALLTGAELGAQPGIAATPTPALAGSLATVVSGAGQLNHWLNGIHLAADLPTALAERATLAAGHSLLTPCGQWLGTGWWLSLNNAASSPLLWQQQWRALNEQQQQLEQQLACEQQQLAQLQLKVADSRQQCAQIQRDRQQQATRLQQLQQQAALAALAQRNRAEQEQQRQQQLQSEQQRLNALQPELQQAAQALAAAQMQLAATEPQLAACEQQLAAMNEQRSPLQQQWQELQQQQQQQARQQAELIAEQKGVTLAALRLTKQQQQLAARCQQLLAEQPHSVADDALAQQLEALLAERQQLDEQLAASGAAISALADERKRMQQQQRRLNQQHEQQRTSLDQLRLEREGLASRLALLAEQLTELAVDVAAVMAQLPPTADEQHWSNELESCTQALARLGPINLAAIEEYDAQAERKAYFDQQYGDLLQAVEALEGAIRRIDKETRQRFRDTFAQIDQGLQQLFPKVFGGGSASLALTDDDLLEAGVAIMARPPGKKNSTIHLLSGGEKALTALSLVFAIFQLNPAPFCMLDEVDAPLDDANVGRFCNLVREMSASVQFVFISHNKVAMEMASHLTGVTMNEPGVSRMVAVDIEQALSFMQTA